MTTVTTDRQRRPIQAPVAWAIAVLTLGYMLPWAVAATRGKSNAGAIGWVNLLLGWTLIGWAAALVMACSAHQRVAVATATPDQDIAAGRVTRHDGSAEFLRSLDE